MKKTIFFIYYVTCYLNYCNGQVIQNKKYITNCCNIIQHNIKIELESYIKRNFKSENEKGVVVLKLQNNNHDTINYEYYITTILKKSSLTDVNFTEFSVIDGHLILLFGMGDFTNCQKKDGNSSYIYTHLIDDGSWNSKNKRIGITFDPEIIKIIVKNNTVISKKELSKQLDLR